MGFFSNLFSKNKVATMSVEEKIENGLISSVSIVNGEVITNFVSKSTAPTIIPDKSVEVLVNGRKINLPHLIQPTDKIVITTSDETIAKMLKLVVSENSMVGELDYIPQCHIKRTIVDHPPTDYLRVGAIESIKYTGQLTQDDIDIVLDNHRVVVGVDFDAINELLQATEPKTIVVARGIPCLEGNDGDIEWRHGVVEQTDAIVRGDGSVDFRENHEIPIIKRDELIAIIIPAVEGIEGSTIYGTSLPPKKIFDLKVKLGKGVYTSEEDKSSIYSKIEGIVRHTRIGNTITVSVELVLIHQGDVQIKSGNIRFEGDIQITGGVEPQMVVESEGATGIGGTVVQATIRTGHDLTIKQNAIKSDLICGVDLLLVLENYGRIKHINATLQRFKITVDQIMADTMKREQRTPTEEYRSFLLRKLIKTRFPIISKQVQKEIDNLKKEPHPLLVDWIGNLEQGVYYLDVYLNKNDAHSAITSYLGILDEMVEQLDLADKPKLTIQYMQGSTVVCAGDLHVFGQGMHNSTVTVHGNAKIDSVMRGGVLYAFGKTVEVREVGTTAGVPTRICAQEYTTVKIDVVHNDTIIQIGRFSHKFIDTKKMIVAHINSDGNLSLN